MTPDEDPKPELVLVSEGTEVEYRGRRAQRIKRAKVDRVWHVVVDGEVIGSIAYVMLTRELRTPGRMYVNARWESPGWKYAAKVYNSAREGLGFARGIEAYSRADAVKRLLWEWRRRKEAEANGN